VILIHSGFLVLFQSVCVINVTRAGVCQVSAWRGFEKPKRNDALKRHTESTHGKVIIGSKISVQEWQIVLGVFFSVHSSQVPKKFTTYL